MSEARKLPGTAIGRKLRGWTSSRGDRARTRTNNGWAAMHDRRTAGWTYDHRSGTHRAPEAGR